MRFIVFVKATKNSEAGVMPSQELLAAMMKYNEELVQAGVMLGGEGLHPSSKGIRVKFSGSRRIVTDGPFVETNEIVAGYWLWQCKSKERKEGRCYKGITTGRQENRRRKETGHISL